MFDVENGHYKIITVTQNGSLQIVKAHLINRPRRCLKPEKLGCRNAVPYSQDGDKCTPHILYGLYDRNTRKPAEFHIYRKRYKCPICGGTFYGDEGNPDFDEHDKALPEFIKYLIKEWLEDSDSTFTSIGKKYSHSKATISDWCGQLVKTFDSKTKCNTRKEMFFSSFRYGKKDPRIHCAIVTKIRGESVLCGIIDDYTDTETLEEKIRARLDRLSNAEVVYYDYYPGVNNVIQKVFSNQKTRIMINVPAFQNEIYDRTYGLSKDDLWKLDFPAPFTGTSYGEWAEKFEEWIDDLPEPNQKEVSEFYEPLKHKETMHHISNLWIEYDANGSYCPEAYIRIRMDVVSGNIPYENFKLRALYSYKDYADEIGKCLDNLVIKTRKGKKKKEEASLLADIQKSMCWQAITQGGVLESDPGFRNPSAEEKSYYGVKRITSTVTIKEESVDEESYSINFFEAFQHLDPNEMFELLPTIRDWYVPEEAIYESVDDEEENRLWLDLDE